MRGRGARSGRGPPSPDERRSPFPGTLRPAAIEAARSRPPVSHASLRTARAISSAVNVDVVFIGDNFAACRISSEYALPMPLKIRGSVRARLSVWFCAVSRAPKAARSAAMTSRPCGLSASIAASPSTMWIDAWRFDPASVKITDPAGKSNAARPDLSGNRGAALAPSQASRDHQVDHRRKPALELDDDSLAKAAQSDHASAGERLRRRGDGADDERVADAQPLERLSENAGRERFEVDRDVRKLRHG